MALWHLLAQTQPTNPGAITLNPSELVAVITMIFFSVVGGIKVLATFMPAVDKFFGGAARRKEESNDFVPSGRPFVLHAVTHDIPQEWKNEVSGLKSQVERNFSTMKDLVEKQEKKWGDFYNRLASMDKSLAVLAATSGGKHHDQHHDHQSGGG